MKSWNKCKEKGSVTIEATISLTAFMFAIVTILTFLDICLVQAKVSYAINSTAKEISQYSYLYSLTGFNDAQKDIYNKGKQNTEDISKLVSDVNTVFNEVESLTGESGANYSSGDTDDIMKNWQDIVGSAENIEKTGASIGQTLEDISGDPKKLMFGIAQMAGSGAMDLAKSRLIAAPISRALCKKHLVSQENGSVDAFLKKKGVVPSANGSYYDGLDFTKSTIFPNGSNEICVNVTYSVKVIALLPVDWEFHFNQSAVTHGWLAGEASYVTDEEYEKNHSIWVDDSITTRSDYIRNREIAMKKDEGYEQVKGLTDVQLYNPETGEFIMISTTNPLFSAEGEDVRTLEDLDDQAIQMAIEQLCEKMNSTTGDLDKVTTSHTDEYGAPGKKTYDLNGVKNKIVLVVPEDEGLKERYQEIIDQTNTRGVTVEVVEGYGKGVRETKVTEPQEKGTDESTKGEQG